MGEEDRAGRGDWVARDDGSAEEERQRFQRARLNRARAASLLIAIIRAAGGAAALILIAYIVLTIGGANPDNGIARFVADWADNLALGFRDLFTPSDARLRVIINYGLAAICWLVITGVLTRFLPPLISPPYLIS